MEAYLYTGFTPLLRQKSWEQHQAATHNILTPPVLGLAHTDQKRVGGAFFLLAAWKVAQSQYRQTQSIQGEYV